MIVYFSYYDFVQTILIMFVSSILKMNRYNYFTNIVMDVVFFRTDLISFIDGIPIARNIQEVIVICQQANNYAIGV